MIDLWTERDLPVLVELVRRLELDGESLVDRPDRLGDLERGEYGPALSRLERAGYIVAEGSMSSRHPETVAAVTEKGLRAAGVWPSAEQLVDRLLEALAATAEHGDSQDERSRARRALDALRGVGRDVLVDAAGGALGGTLT